MEPGERRKVIDGVWYFHGASPGSRYLLYFRDNQFRTYDITTGRRHDLTGTLARGSRQAPITRCGTGW